MSRPNPNCPNWTDDTPIKDIGGQYHSGKNDCGEEGEKEYWWRVKVGENWIYFFRSNGLYGNPLYQTFDKIEEYIKKCQQ